MAPDRRSVPPSPGGADLPAPDADAAAHSARLQALIAEAIEAAGGAIPFRRFMELALYAPGLGYYSAGAHKLGAAGDFATAPELSPLFARTLARPCRDVLTAVDGGEVLEVGPGSGALAATLLAELAALDALPTRYALLEVSADLRARQAALLRDRVPRLMDRVAWLEDLPDPGFRGVVIANELLDALPVHRLVLTGDGALEQYVGLEGASFAWRRGPLSDARLAARADTLRAMLGAGAAGYISEVNLAAEDWVAALAGRLARAAVFLIDYGYPRSEYYHPQRRSGTLACHYRHRRHEDPLRLVGLQDITAHVEFTAIAEAAVDAGLAVSGYTTQAHFLLGSGLTDVAGTPRDTEAQMAAAGQIRRLTLPQEMGEVVKVMGLTRELALDLPGLRLRDLRHTL